VEDKPFANLKVKGIQYLTADRASGRLLLARPNRWSVSYGTHHRQVVALVLRPK